MQDFDLPKRIAFITAHPDDETEIAAGTIYLNTQKGGKNFLFCATRGEKGKTYLKENLSEVALGQIREQELRRTGAFLGISDIVVSDFKDGAVANDLARLEKEIKNFLTATNPELVVSFGEDGYSGHKDHTAIYQVLKKLLDQKPNWNFMQFAGPTEAECLGYEECLLKKRKNGSYDPLRRVQPNVRVLIDPEVKRKAISFYETQLAGLDPYNIFPNEVAEHIMKYEYFYRD